MRYTTPRQKPGLYRQQLPDNVVELSLRRSKDPGRVLIPCRGGAEPALDATEKETLQTFAGWTVTPDFPYTDVLVEVRDVMRCSQLEFSSLWCKEDNRSLGPSVPVIVTRVEHLGIFQLPSQFAGPRQNIEERSVGLEVGG